MDWIVSKKKEDILKYFRDINYVYNDCTRLDSLKNALSELEEVVRCKDCKYRDTINCGMQFYGYDDDGHLCKSDDWTQDDGFCYWGESKDV